MGEQGTVDVPGPVQVEQPAAHVTHRGVEQACDVAWCRRVEAVEGGQ